MHVKVEMENMIHAFAYTSKERTKQELGSHINQDKIEKDHLPAFIGKRKPKGILDAFSNKKQNLNRYKEAKPEQESC